MTLASFQILLKHHSILFFQDVVMHNTKLKRNKDSTKIKTPEKENTGLKGLSREKREQLEGYQNLFYLLQTNPTYLARLIFKMPQVMVTPLLLLSFGGLFHDELLTCPSDQCFLSQACIT